MTFDLSSILTPLTGSSEPYQFTQVTWGDQSILRFLPFILLHNLLFIIRRDPQVQESHMWETDIQLSQIKKETEWGVAAEINREMKAGRGEDLVLDFTLSFCSVGNFGDVLTGGFPKCQARCSAAFCVWAPGAFPGTPIRKHPFSPSIFLDPSLD